MMTTDSAVSYTCELHAKRSALACVSRRTGSATFANATFAPSPAVATPAPRARGLIRCHAPGLRAATVSGAPACAA